MRGTGPAPPPPHRQRHAADAPGRHRRRTAGQGAPGPDTARAWEALEHAIIGKAVDLLSGPGGLASFLRRRQLGARLAGPSLPLDVGFARHSRWDPQRSHPARPALPVDRTAATSPPVPVRCTTHAQERRRQDQRQRLRAAVFLPSPGGHPPVGLDPRPEPRRHHHRVEPGQDQDPPQPQPTGQPGVTPRVSRGTGFTESRPDPMGKARRGRAQGRGACQRHSGHDERARPISTMASGIRACPRPQAESGHEHSPQPDQRRLRLPMLRDPARGSCPSTSRT